MLQDAHSKDMCVFKAFVIQNQLFFYSHTLDERPIQHLEWLKSINITKLTKETKKCICSDNGHLGHLVS